MGQGEPVLSYRAGLEGGRERGRRQAVDQVGVLPWDRGVAGWCCFGVHHDDLSSSVSIPSRHTASEHLAAGCPGWALVQSLYQAYRDATTWTPVVHTATCARQVSGTLAASANTGTWLCYRVAAGLAIGEPTGEDQTSCRRLRMREDGSQ